MHSSIFAFLKDTPYASCFTHLEEFEKKFLLDPDGAGDSLREFWESFTIMVINQRGMKNDYVNSLQGKNSECLASRLYFLRKNQVIKSYPIKTEYEYTGKDRSKKWASRFLPGYNPKDNKLFILDYFRWYANQFHHVDAQLMDASAPKFDVNFHQTLDYISLMYKYLLNFLGEPVKKQVDFTKMPLSINNGQTAFYMESELITSMDPSQLHCRYTFSGVMYPNQNNEDSHFAIIQLFDKNEVDQKQLERCATMYHATRPRKFGEALRDIRVLAGYHGNAEFYILAYIFEEPALQLTSRLLRDICMDDRLILCREIARIIAELHSATPAIAHRFLNHNCIYVCKNIESDIRWYPAITGFSLAKINQQNQPTVLDKAIKDRIAQQIPYHLMPYIPANWVENVNDNGDQVDVYSMGMLFFHILTGKFSHNIQVNDETPIHTYFPTIRTALTEVGSDVADLIIEMLNPLGVRRPSAKEVYQRLEHLCGK